LKKHGGKKKASGKDPSGKVEPQKKPLQLGGRGKNTCETKNMLN